VLIVAKLRPCRVDSRLNQAKQVIDRPLFVLLHRGYAMLRQDQRVDGTQTE
jgi:hypothetical protein